MSRFSCAFVGVNMEMRVARRVAPVNGHGAGDLRTTVAAAGTLSLKSSGPERPSGSAEQVERCFVELFWAELVKG